MTADVVWWDLAGTGVTVDDLEQDLRLGTADAWQDVEGLRLKLWIADRRRGRWGAVMWWDGPRPPAGSLPPNRALELIGAPPAHRSAFEIAAVTAPVHPPWRISA